MSKLLVLSLFAIFHGSLGMKYLIEDIGYVVTDTGYGHCAVYSDLSHLGEMFFFV